MSKDDDEIREFLSGRVRETARLVDHHERGLTKSHRHMAVLHALMQRCGMTMTTTEALAEFTDEEADMNPEDCNTPEEFARHLYASASFGIRFHEEELEKEYRNRAGLKALIVRCGLELPVAELEREGRGENEGG